MIIVNLRLILQKDDIFPDLLWQQHSETCCDRMGKSGSCDENKAIKHSSWQQIKSEVDILLFCLHTSIFSILSFYQIVKNPWLLFLNHVMSKTFFALALLRLESADAEFSG